MVLNGLSGAQWIPCHHPGLSIDALASMAMNKPWNTNFVAVAAFYHVGPSIDVPHHERVESFQPWLPA